MDTPALDFFATKTATFGSFARGLLPIGGAVAGGYLGNEYGHQTGDVALDTGLGVVGGLTAGSVSKSILEPAPLDRNDMLAAMQTQHELTLKRQGLEAGARPPTMMPY